MLRPKKKILKKEMKQDALVTTYARVTAFYEENKRTVGIATTVVAVVVIAVLVMLKNRADANESASLQLGQVQELYASGQYQAAIDGVPERNVPGLKAIVDNYGSSRGGELARFMYANALFELGKYDEALQQFEDFSAPDDMLAASRYAGIAQCYEARKDYKEAARNFEKAAGKNTKDISIPEYLNQAARNYGLAGEKERAIELYKRLKKNYPTSLYARDADRFVAQMSL
jgi:tetratricopeptide (TPR) repeat protein